MAAIIAAQVLWTEVARAECGPYEDETQTTHTNPTVM